MRICSFNSKFYGTLNRIIVGVGLILFGLFYLASLLDAKMHNDVHHLLWAIGVAIFSVFFIRSRSVQWERVYMSFAWAIFLTPVLFVVGYQVLRFCINSTINWDRPFEKDAWNKGPKYEFSECIINSRMLLGKTKAEVRELISSGVDIEGNSDSTDCWGFNLGWPFPEYDWNFENGWYNFLVIYFENDRVIQVADRHTYGTIGFFRQQEQAKKRTDDVQNSFEPTLRSIH